MLTKFEIRIGIGERDTYLEKLFGSTLNCTKWQKENYLASKNLLPEFRNVKVTRNNLYLLLQWEKACCLQAQVKITLELQSYTPYQQNNKSHISYTTTK